MTAPAPFLNAPLLALLHLAIAIYEQQLAAAERAIAELKAGAR